MGVLAAGLAWLAAGGLPAPAAAQDVVVTKAAARRSSIDRSGFATPATEAGRRFDMALRTALQRSGWFAEARPGAGEFTLTGRLRERGDRLVVEADLREGRRSVLRRTYEGGAGEARTLAHRLSDDLVQAVTGRPGFAASRLVLVGGRRGSKELYLSDADGQGLMALTRDGSISLYPRWSPDARRIVYTGYLRGFPDLYLIELATGERRRISGFPGLNTGGAMAPDGRRIALILSKDGNPELYVRDLQSATLTRLTRTPRAAESSPSWSPDGRRIVYVSDISGSPQLYLIDRDGGAPRRLTGRGRENVAPDWGPHGWIVYSTRVGAEYRLAMLNPDTGESRSLNLPPGDWEDPSWARDGRHVAAARTVGRRSSVWLVDTVEEEAVILVPAGEREWFSPSWSP